MLDQDLNASRRPAYDLSVGGRSITHLADQRLISLTLTDCRGFEADTLELVLDDSDGALELPRKGATVRVAIGWADTGTVDKGSYVVDEIEHSGAPDRLSIRARSANLRASLTEKREQSWHSTTVGDVLTAMCTRHSLTPAISPSMASLPITHIDQTNESDINIITRLAKEHGAIAAIKDGHLIFTPAGKGTTASGKPLPVATITRKDGDHHRFAVADREAYTAVRATYFDVKRAQRGEVIVNGETAKALREKTVAAEQAANTSINHGALTWTIATPYANKANAIKGAKAVLAKGQYTAVRVSYDESKAKKRVHLEVTNTSTKVLSNANATTDLQAIAPTTAPAPTFSDAGNVLSLRHTYATKESALRGAYAAWSRLQRGVATFSVTLALGRPELIAEQPVAVSGFKDQINAIDWTITRVTHSISENGYTTAIELEVKVDEMPDTAEDPQE